MMFIDFITHIENKKSNKLLLAISGGIDSMVLLHLCQQNKMNIAVAHCNFQLRSKDSNDDEEFVKNYCTKHHIPFYTKKFETQQIANQNKESIQVVARNLRYTWFEELLQEYKFDYLFTAHHLDDQVETFLINFTRGTGINGLLGIPMENGKIYRPLLNYSKSDIENYAQKNNISWREDISNQSDKYLRNKLRHEVIPILKEINPSFLNSFQNSLHSLQSTQDFLQEMIQKITETVVLENENQQWISIKKLLEIKNYKEFLFHFLQPYGFSAWEDIFLLIHAQSGKTVFSNEYQILKDRDFLILSLRQNFQSEEYIVNNLESDTKFPLKLTIWEEKNNLQFDKNAIFVDFNKIQFPLKIRKWNEGDYFFPFGMKGKKKVSKFFKDQKLNLFQKNEIWILESNQEIVWIVGHRLDDRYKVDHQTSKILKMEYLKT